MFIAALFREGQTLETTQMSFDGAGHHGTPLGKKGNKLQTQ